jgi:hypothetical protein
MAVLTKQWSRGPMVPSKELTAMVSEGLIWKSFEVIGMHLYPRYCIAHDVSKTWILNDHKIR